MNSDQQTTVSIGADGLIFSPAPQPAKRGGTGKHAELVDALYLYLERLRTLTSETYRGFAPVLPAHLTSSVNLYVVPCEEGALFRADQSTNDESSVFVLGGNTLSWEDTCTFWSQGYIRFDTESEIAKTIPKMALKAARNTADGIQAELFAKDLSHQLPNELSTPTIESIRPIPALTVGGIATVQVEGTWGSLTDENAGETPFVHVTPAHALLPWCEINFYTHDQLQRWTKTSASAIAERDILFCAANALAAQSNILAEALHSSRTWYTEKLASLRGLIDDSTTPEESIHQLIKECPWMLAWGAKFVRSKVAFGSHVSDFVVASADGSYTLVELEPASHRLFLKDGDQSKELRHAIEQISDWVRFISANRDMVDRELKLPGISTHPFRMVVIGRSTGLSIENIAKLKTTMELDRGLRIWTYDDLLRTAEASLETAFGPALVAGGISFLGRRPA